MSSLLFDFTVDKATKTVFITREFAAGQSLVWDAFTKAELLDQWWAPKPFTSKTIKMDFRVGGRRFYAMVNQEGVEIGWQLFDFTSIIPKSNFTCTSVFTDRDETPLIPPANWDLRFNEQRGITKVTITILFESLEGLENMIELGFKEGFTATLIQLTHLLSSLKHKL